MFLLFFDAENLSTSLVLGRGCAFSHKVLKLWEECFKVGFEFIVLIPQYRNTRGQRVLAGKPPRNPPQCPIDVVDVAIRPESVAVLH